MRRIALALAAVGVVALALGGAPAQAHEGWWGGYQWRQHEWREQAWREHEWREHEWREHHGWRAAGFERHVLPRVIFGLLHR
jgi:hypothetical protein